MSLETRIVEMILEGPLKNVFFIRNDVLNKGYGGYVNYLYKKFNMEFVVDSSGKIVFGGIHGFSYKIVTVDGLEYLEARDRRLRAGHNYYRIGGSLGFGGKHYDSKGFVEMGGINYLKAQHTKTGLWSFYKADGTVLSSFGGPHHLIGKFHEINSKKYLFAQHKEEDGFGYFDENGSCFNTTVEAGLSQIKEDISPFGFWELVNVLVKKIYYTSTGEEEQKTEFLSGVISSVKERAKLCKDDPVLLKKSLAQFVQGMDYFAKHPDEALSFSGGGLRE